MTAPKNLIAKAMWEADPISPQQAMSMQATINRIKASVEKYGVLYRLNGIDLGEEPADPLILMMFGQATYPCFQFKDGKILPIIAEMRRIAAEYGWTDYDLIVWLTRPQNYLIGSPVPADLISDEEWNSELLRVLPMCAEVPW